MMVLFNFHLILICLAFWMGYKFIRISLIVGREEEKPDGFDCLEFYQKGKLKFQLRRFDFFMVGLLYVIFGFVELVSMIKMLDAN